MITSTQHSHWLRIGLNAGVALVAQIRFGWPQRGMQLLAITGTDGKTTTAEMLSAVLRHSGRKVGTISTVGSSINGRRMALSPHVSTPGPWQLYQLLAKMRRDGVRTVVIEVTSHGLDQRRTFGLRFAVGVITNISPEHLDYHGNLASYAASKARLCQLSQVMVLNHDDRMVAAMASLAAEWLWFGRDAASTVWPSDIEHQPDETSFELHIEQQACRVSMPFVGQHNVFNALAAVGVAHRLGLTLSDIAAGLADAQMVMGRWHVVQQLPFMVVVDFGHTPQAFSQVLPLARQYIGHGGRLIHVFGSAGSRDASKRQRMGELSARFADLSVVTMEDPRREPLDGIQQQIVDGMNKVGRHDHQWQRIDDRSQAIIWAIDQARLGDVVLLTGKGHEKSMNIDGQEVAWDEVAVAKEGLERKRLSSAKDSVSST